MTTERGFTLLEVLVALAIVAVALGAIIKSAGESAANITYLRDKTVAGWVAENELNKILINREWPELGDREGVSEMAEREWRWQTRVQETADEDLRQVEITVQEEDSDAILARLITFKGRFQ